MTNFSVDADVLRREPDLRTFLPENQADFSQQHLAAHDEIITDLKQGRIIVAEEQIAEPEELRLLSTYKVLEIVMRFLSASDGDKFQLKADYYAKAYRDEFEDLKNSLSIDANQDGVLDEDEAGASQQTIIQRW